MVQIVTCFVYRPPSRPLGSLTPTQPGRVTNPTQGHPGPPFVAPQVECWSLRREPKPRTGLAPGHATARALAQQQVPANGCHLAFIQGVPGGSSGAPALSTRARYGLRLSPLSLSTIVTLSGSHVIAGAAAAMSSLGSAVGIAMMVGGRGAPLLAAWLGTDWMRTPGWAPSCSVGNHFPR